MEHVVIKTEDGLYDDFEISEDTVETSDNLFGVSHYQESNGDNCNRDDQSNAAQSRRASWLARDCKLLISLYKEEYQNMGKPSGAKTKRKLWERITKRLKEHGLFFTTVQVEGKWKSLKRSYANAIANRKMGKTRKIYPFEKDLSEMLLRPLRRAASRHQSESTETSGGGKEQLLTDTEDETSIVSVGGRDTPLPKEDSSSDYSGSSVSQDHESTSFAKELRKLRKEIAKGRREKRKYRKAKLKAYAKRTAALEKQNYYKQELLSAYPNSQNKK